MTTNVDRPMLIRGLAAGEFTWANPAFYAQTGLTPAALTERAFVDWVDPADRASVEAMLDETMPDASMSDASMLGDSTPAGGACRSFRVGHSTHDGQTLPLEVSLKASPDGWRVLGRGVSDDDVLGAYVEAFDRGTVSGTLETIARIVEDQNPGYKCSILLANRDRFARGAGPSLPEDYNAAIDGYAIGPAIGSCGTAIFWGVPVIVEDIQADPLWLPLAELAAKAGVHSCWSHPFTNSAGDVLGALALYSPEPRAPTAAQLEGLKAAARMTGLAVERGRVEEALREKRKRELELEEQLRQAAKMEALGVLAGGVAHDFNNLLTTISGNAELALMQLGEDHAARSNLDRIVVTSQRAGEFCSQMLAYAGRGTIRTGRVEVKALLAELSDLAHAALSKKATLTYSLHTEPIYVDADENQLLQVVLSLVTNAAEAIGDEEGTIEVATELAEYDAATLGRLAPDLTLSAGSYLRLTVRDTGAGMDDKTRARIFDPFFTTKFTGRGLGLAAVTGIVRKHGGLIRVESEPGVGTTFEVLLPTVDALPRAEPAARAAASGAPTTRHVLVVDDEEGPRQVFRRVLEVSGFSVAEAIDGEDALRVFREDPQAVDCVLLDLSMPRLGGHEVFREIRSIRDDVPVVVISGYSEQEILDRLDGAPVARVLRKPIGVDALVDTIRDVTAGSESAG